MGLTVTDVDVNILGARKSKVLDVTFDSSYPTGGEALTPASVGFTEFLFVLPAPSAGYVFEYDATNEKVIAYWVDTTTDGAPMAEVANTTDLSSVTSKVLVVGF